MKNVLIALLVIACACGKKKEPPPAAGSGAGSAAMGSAGSAGSAEAPPPAPYTPAATVPDPIKNAIAAPDRSVDDRRLDAGRKPGEVFAFFGIAPGQKVAELFSGTGYSTEIVARVVGDGGHVYGQNTKEILEKFARKPWTDRLAKPAMKNVVPLERPIDDPFPADLKGLDAVIFILNYHDTVWLKADRAKMNKAVFDALKSGGVYGIVDHSAVVGTGTKDAEDLKGLHRIDEDVVKQEVTAAGFKLEGESDVLKNPDDKRDWSTSPRAAGEKRGTSDRFVLKFVKP